MCTCCINKRERDERKQTTSEVCLCLSVYVYMCMCVYMYVCITTITPHSSSYKPFFSSTGYKENFIAVSCLLLVAKFCSSMTYLLAYLQAAELHPTSIRSLITGLASLVALTANIFSPSILAVVRRGRRGTGREREGERVIWYVSGGRIERGENMVRRETCLSRKREGGEKITGC